MFGSIVRFKDCNHRVALFVYTAASVETRRSGGLRGSSGEELLLTCGILRGMIFLLANVLDNKLLVLVNMVQIHAVYHKTPLACLSIFFFQAIPGVPKIKDGYNPAAWMLEVTSQGTENKLNVNFFEIYKNSALFE